MKKIKFGSFPLVDMSSETRDCIDTYSIKSFADLITMNTQMKSTNSDLQKYITPDVILKYFKVNGITDLPSDKNSEVKDKMGAMKRAFMSLQNFSKMISGNPFYQNRVTYPIYLEHENKNNSHDYDFILLANDLIPKEILDEIKYDDTLTLTFLFIKDMLYPRIPLSEIGVGDSYTIRSDIAKFIEFSKSNNTDPVSAMLKLIKIAGLKKKRGDTNYSGLASFVNQNKAGKDSISNKFFKLFGGDRHTGQIKDVNFLLNEINHLDIADFFDDSATGTPLPHKPGQLIAPNNQRSHTGYSNHQATDDISSVVSRQYIAQKTQDYNKILSIVDSLINFNSNTEIMTDVESQIKDGTVRLAGRKGQEVEVNINYDRIINSLRNDYFEAFVVNLIQKLNILQKKYYEQATGVVGNRNVITKKSSNAERIEDTNREIMSLNIKINDILNGHGGVDQIENLKDLLRIQENKLNHLETAGLFLSNESRAEEARQLLVDNFKSAITYNIESVQSELTGVLHDIEGSLYDNKIYQKLFDIIGNRQNVTFDKLDNLFREEGILIFNIEQLRDAIIEGINDTLISDANASDAALEPEERAEEKVYMYLNNQKTKNKMENEILIIINNQILLLFKRLGREYGDQKVFATQQYADLRTNKNAIIRKTITNADNFKTFILNEDVIGQLYEMLNYIDTQKYIAGLIAYPPAKITNELNVMKYIIKRLGLDNNPVFIIGNNSVILSQPDFLSLTGTTIFSKISLREMENICKIDYHQSLWNNKQMFKQTTAKVREDNKEAYGKLFSDMKAAADAEKIIFDKANADIITLTKKRNEATDSARILELEAEITAAKQNKETARTTHNTIRTEAAANIKKFNVSDSKYSNDGRVDAGQPLGTSSYTQESYKPQDKKGDNKKPYTEIHKIGDKNRSGRNNGGRNGGNRNGGNRNGGNRNGGNNNGGNNNGRRR